MSNGLIFVMLIQVNEMTKNVVKEGNEQKEVSRLVREGWRNGERKLVMTVRYCQGWEMSCRP